MAPRSPKRIQRKRTRGWRMPKGAVYVGRPTRFGNPYRVDGTHSLSNILMLYESWLMREISAGRLDLADLRGHDLACWCPLSSDCHADILLRLANT